MGELHERRLVDDNTFETTTNELKLAELDVTSREASLEQAQAILAEAQRGYDLMVLGAVTRGTNGDGPLFEHFVDDVIQESPCPLLVVTSREDEDPAARTEDSALKQRLDDELRDLD